MERLEFNSLGQWMLIKASKLSPDQDFMSNRNPHDIGELPRDRGRKGSLHNQSNRRAPKKMSIHRMEGHVQTPIKSAAIDRSPGTGIGV